MGFLFVAVVTRLKADNPLYGSSLIDYVRPLLLLLLSLSLSDCVRQLCSHFGCLNFRLILSSGSILRRWKLMLILGLGLDLEWDVLYTFLRYVIIYSSSYNFFFK
jgi:hypothetical protein